MGRKAKVWKIREDYRPLLIETKKLFPTLLGHVNTKRVALAGIYNRKNSHVARIYGNKPPWSLLTDDYDYIIVFWSTRFDDKPHSYKVFVMLHELVHVPFDGFIEGSPSRRRCVKHDIEDFAFLRERYGIHLDKMSDVMKGEKHLLKKDEIRRFPRLEHIG